jgi:ArsR family transcriptional regulator, arsenate/arsenite/antimonite-responsive transcriptional repressor
MVGTMSVDTMATELDERVAALKAVADPTRLRVLESLDIDGPRCHCELERTLGVPANRLSFHLKVLRDAGLVTTRRRGRLTEYHLEPERIAELHAALPGVAPRVTWTTTERSEVRP